MTIGKNPQICCWSWRDMGAPKELIAESLYFALVGNLSKDHKRFIAAPIIQAQSMWSETTPQWLYYAIDYDRLSVVLDELKRGEGAGWQVGATELTLVLYPSTVDAPMRHEYAQIYLWAGAYANSRRYKKPLEYYWDIISTKIWDEDILNPQGQDHYYYRDLCADIRRKAVALQMERERAVARFEKIAPKQNTSQSNDQEMSGIQLDLF
jgi:hypothetical protein